MSSVCDSAGPRIPVLLVTGFLGSGKTTLINHFLRTKPFERAAVVVNEFGQVSIDHVLVAAPRSRMRVIDSGCLCGHVHEEVASSLLDLLERRYRDPRGYFDAVLIETSGLADPVPIIQILATDKTVSAYYELRSVITVADSLHGTEHLDHHIESVKQAAVADMIVMSKADLAGATAVDALDIRLESINRDALRLRAGNGRLDVALLADQALFRPSQPTEHARHWLADGAYVAKNRLAAADPRIGTFSLSHDGEVTVPGLVLWLNLLAGFRGAGLLRVKGIVNVEGRPYAIQAVQTVISEPMPLDDWPEGDDRRSRLVFITRGMDADEIRRTFAAFDFNAGRASRNMVINPAHYDEFKKTIELFRQSPTAASRQVGMR